MTFKFKTLLIALSSLSSCVCDEVQQTHGVDMTAVAMDLSDINLNFLQADSTTSAQVDTINISEKDPESTSKDSSFKATRCTKKVVLLLSAAILILVLSFLIDKLVHTGIMRLVPNIDDIGRVLINKG